MLQPITNASGKIVSVGFDKKEAATIEANATGRDISGQNDANASGGGSDSGLGNNRPIDGEQNGRS